MRQKLFLTGIFLLMGCTIAVTIARGGVFQDAYKSVDEFDRKVINMAWMLFWFMIQYFVCESFEYRVPFSLTGRVKEGRRILTTNANSCRHCLHHLFSFTLGKEAREYGQEAGRAREASARRPGSHRGCGQLEAPKPLV